MAREPTLTKKKKQSKIQELFWEKKQERAIRGENGRGGSSLSYYPASKFNTTKGDDLWWVENIRSVCGHEAGGKEGPGGAR